MDADSFARVQKALAEPKRIEILETIRRMQECQGVTCSQVLQEMSVSQSTFSHHVSELAKADLILERREGKYSRLSVNEAVVGAYLDTLRSKMLG